MCRTGRLGCHTAHLGFSLGATTTEAGGLTWLTVQRSRQQWQAHKPVTSGLPLLVTGSVSTTSPLAHSIPNAQFISIGSYVVSLVVPTGTQVVGVNAAASIVSISNPGNSNLSGQTLLFNQAPYPWPDQIVTNGFAVSSTSPVVQCTQSGVTGVIQPIWSTVLGMENVDGSVHLTTCRIQLGES